MDHSAEVKHDGTSVLGCLVVLIVLAPAHTILARMLGHVCTSIVRTNLYRIIHIVLFCAMSSTRRFFRMSWTLMAGDEPTERLPTHKIGDLMAEIGLMVTYGSEVLFFNYARAILYFFWSQLIRLFYLGLALLIFLPVCTRTFIWIRQRKGYLYRSESTFIRSLRFLLTGIVGVCSLMYQFFVYTVQLPKDYGAYLREASRLQPETMKRTAANSAYHYEELHAPSQEIRLIKLTKSLSKGIQCTVKRFSLSDAPMYEAISYTWGSPNKDHVVILNGHWLLTTKNVYNIIQDRASYSRTRWLWIDAVCINQTNTTEKNSQVNIMGEIYKSADRVIVWLGDMHVKTSSVMSTCFLLNKLDYNIRHLEYYKERIENLDLVTGSAGMWEALRQFLSHPYWHRTWIIQEVAKARKVYILYGGWYLSWDLISPTLQLLTQDPGNIMYRETQGFKVSLKDLVEGVFQVTMIAGVRLHLQDNKRLHLEDALKSTFKCEATDRRDRIFALYNLIDLGKVDGGIQMTPCYTTPVEVVYAHTALYILSYHSSFGLLRSGIGHTRSISELPSWVPDWTAHITHPMAGKGEYHATGASTLYGSKHPHSRNKTTLELLLYNVMPISEVKLISETPHPKTVTGDQQKDEMSFRAFYDAANSTAFMALPSLYRATGQFLTEALWRTLIGDRHFTKVEHQMQRPADYIYAEYFELWRTEVEGTKELSILPDGGFDYAKAMGIVCSDGRRLAVTDDGLMAIVPQFTEVGDVICLVGGVEKPLLMRPDSGDEKGHRERWRLVGDCYVHGIMDGEKWDEGKGARSFILY